MLNLENNSVKKYDKVKNKVKLYLPLLKSNSFYSAPFQLKVGEIGIKIEGTP